MTDSDNHSSAETERAYLSEIETRKQIASLLSEFFPGKQWYRDLAAKAIYDRIPGVAQPTRMAGGDWAQLLTLRDVMKTAYKRGGDRLMSVWERDLNAIEAAIMILDKAARPPAAPVDQERLAELQNEAGMYKSLYENAIAQRSSAERAEALRLLAAEDDRQTKLHELLETIREQIRLEVAPEHRPEGLFKNIQDAVYAMRGRTRLMDDAAITHVLNEPQAPATREEISSKLAEFFCGKQNLRDRAAEAILAAYSVSRPEHRAPSATSPDAAVPSQRRPE
jgi:hypothetical protein